MLEAKAHKQIKRFLHQASSPWPHNLTLSRLVARSLRRRDNTLVELDFTSQDHWWLGLLIPLCLDTSGGVLVLSSKQRRHFLQVELPKVKAGGLSLPIWEEPFPPLGSQLWILNFPELINAYKQGFLASRQLIIPEAEKLADNLRDAMSITIATEDWERLRRTYPSIEAEVVQLHEKLSRRLFAHASRKDALVKLDGSEVLALKDLIGVFKESPYPWPELSHIHSKDWVSWAKLDHRLLSWSWHLQPLDPFNQLKLILSDKQPSLLLTKSLENYSLISQWNSKVLNNKVKVKLGTPILQEPISLFVPYRQPLPNTETFSLHLLDLSRRLILGQAGLTMILLDDDELRTKLTAQLAAEYGLRVVHEATAPEINGVICCRFSWWIEHQAQLPLPDQLIIALLPLKSLENPLTSARVELMKRQGHDWFRELLLPEALNILQQSLNPIRASSGAPRVAILDGRIRARSWGQEVLRTLEPWTPITRLLPN